MSVRQSRKQPPASPWPVYVQARLLDRMRAIAGLLRSQRLDADQVHRARRLLKEANALARLLEECPGADARQASRGFARLRHRLNDQRDLDVVEAALHRFAAAEDDRAGALERALDDRRAAVAAAALPTDMAEMRAQMRELIAAVRAWDLSEAEPEALASAARRIYRALRQRGAVAFDTRAAHELHELRKPLIVHRYQLEALERAWPKLFKAWAAEAQLLRDKLGEHHDLMMLCDFIRENAGPEAADLIARVEAAQSDLVREAEPIFDRLCAERPRAFERRLRACLSNTKKSVKSDPGAEQPQEPAGDCALAAPDGETNALPLLVEGG